MSEFRSNQIPLRLVLSLMVVTMGSILSAFLAYVGVRYAFKWPGLVKSVVSGVLLVVCLAYAARRGDRDLKLMWELPSGDMQVGVPHAGLIMLFVFALTALAMWILVGPPQSSVEGPLGIPQGFG